MTKTCPGDILKVAQSVRAKYPKGANKNKCLDANNEIFEALTPLGFNCSIQFGCFNGLPHSWVEVWLNGEAMLLDVTADQFGDYPSIWWTPMNDDRGEYVYDENPD